MKGFFDTSVLVPVFYGVHIHHRASLELFIQFDKTNGCCGAHIRERLSIVALSGDEYADALAASAALGIVGGGIYDAMLAQCAVKAHAEVIYSWNTRHYERCGADVTRRLRTP